MRRHREARAQPVGRVSQVPAASGRGFARDAWPRRVRPELAFRGSQRGVLRSTRGGDWGAPGEDPGMDRGGCLRPSSFLILGKRRFQTFPVSRVFYF